MSKVELTPEGQRLRNVLVKHMGLTSTKAELPHTIAALNTAAALLLTAPEREGAGLREAWRCPKCRCNTFAAVDERKPDGSFGPGDLVRCVNCKGVFFSALTKQPAAQEPSAAGVGLEAYLTRQWSWSKDTFGPALRTKGIIQHITKELREIEAKPHDLSEWVDVMILAMDGFWRHGGKPQDLLPLMQAKQDKNFARNWPDWRTVSEDSAIEHDRSGEATLTPAAPKTPDAATGGSAGVAGLREAFIAGVRWQQPNGDGAIREDTSYEAADAYVAAQPVPVGEDETGVREAERLHQEARADFDNGTGSWGRVRDTEQALDAARALATQPPKAETPAGAGDWNRQVALIADGIRGGNAHGSTADMLRSIAKELNTRLPATMEVRHLLERAAFLDRATCGLAALSTAPAARPGDEVSVDVQTMNTTRGPDFFVRIKCGERSTTPFVFRERFKAAFEVDHLAFVFGLRPDEPNLLDYDEISHPNVPAAAPAANGGRA